jgi:hypothetical protein
MSNPGKNGPNDAASPARDAEVSRPASADGRSAAVLAALKDKAACRYPTLFKEFETPLDGHAMCRSPNLCSSRSVISSSRFRDGGSTVSSAVI